MFANGQTLIQLFESQFPKYLAVPEDKIGLQVGTLQKKIKKVLVTLEVTDAVVDEAIKHDVDLIIAHHAVIFRPLEHLRTDTTSGMLYEKLIKQDIAVYIAHTNLDVAESGINDMMAAALQMKQCEPLVETYEEELYKLVVFVPVSHHEQVLQAISKAGAGWIGNYSHCTFNLEGAGTFLPQEGTDPFIGERGKLERVDEVRLETVVPASLQSKVLQALRKAHPYEEPAYDLYKLEIQGKKYGLGRIGRIEQPMTFAEFAQAVKQALNVNYVHVTGDLNKTVQKVAVLGGAGAKYMGKAKFAGADVYVTGDIDYHTAQDALSSGICLIDPGHHAEKLMKDGVAKILTSLLQKYRTEVITSKVDTDPFQII